MTIDALDHLAYRSTGLFHQSRPVTKLLLVGAVIALILTTTQITPLILTLLLLIGLIISAGVPLIPLLLFATYPLVFVLVFGLSLAWTPTTLLIGGLKVFTASTSLLLLATSTPYPQIFSTISPVISRPFASLLLLTYRSLFILNTVFSETLAIMHLRGAFSWQHPSRTLHAIANTAGITLFKSIELSEKMYETMRLRGFRNMMYYTPRAGTLCSNDIIITLATIVIISMIFLF